MNFGFSPNQQVRVDLMNPAILTTPGATFFGPASDWVIASVLGQQEVVAAGFNLWKTVKFDLSAYQGQTLLIALRTTIEQFFLFASWDNVQVTAPRLSARKAPAKVSRKKTNVLVQGPNGCNKGGCKPFASRAVHG
ncbi:hypothetical protein OEZ85_002081 [Tetradesmus obliquus]|nr:hypothetical protein OEZ85_002081 [Tetradesmus obliquus]